MYQERKLSSKEIEFRVNNEYQIRQPKGAHTILDKQNNFIGFILSKPKPEKKSIILLWNMNLGFFSNKLKLIECYSRLFELIEKKKNEDNYSNFAG
ncbi:30282_t:CDS:1, partial [Racocetra persica]